MTPTSWIHRSTAAWMPIAALGAALLMAAPVLHAQQLTTLAVDGRTSANPTVAVDGAFVAVVWSAATVSSMDIFAAVSRDGGATFSAPVQVNAVAGEARVSGEEPPRVALVSRTGALPEIVVVWTARAGQNWKLLTARSTDGGRAFSAATAVPGSAGDGSRGWQSLAVDALGRVSVLWLDHRGTVVADSMHKHTMAAGGTSASTSPMPKADPTERAGLSALYFAPLNGSKATSITKSPCYCCKTAMVADGDNLFAVWRHVFPGGHRDIAFTRSSDRGRTFFAPTRVSDDRWKLDGCPDNGPSLAVDRTHRVHVAWPTPADGKTMSDMALFYAVSRDGKTFGPRTRIPTRGPAQHVQLAIGTDGSPVLAWDEIVDGTRRLGLARANVNPAGAVSFTPLAPPDAGPGQWYPALASAASGAVVVWVKQLDKGSSIGVARVR